MERSPAEGLFRRYKNLIGYAAHIYARRSATIDPGDLFQEGCLLMLEFFDGRADTQDEHVHNTFKKSLFLWVRRRAIQQMKKARPNGRSMVRLSASPGTFNSVPDDALPSLDFDEMLAAADIGVLRRMYAEEFVAELRRVLDGADLTIFELLAESVDDETWCGNSRGDVIRRAVALTGMSKSTVYERITRIRDAAVRALSRSA